MNFLSTQASYINAKYRARLQIRGLWFWHIATCFVARYIHIYNMVTLVLNCCNRYPFLQFLTTANNGVLK